MLNVGDTIYLELEHPNRKKERFKSKVVEEVRHKNQLTIDLPINVKTSKTGVFYEGTQFKAWFVIKDDSIYSFETELKKRIKKEVPMLIMDYPNKDRFIRLQRRQYARVEVAIDVAVHSDEHKFEPFNTVTNDLSGGGLSMILPKNHLLNKDMSISCLLVLPMNSGEIHYLRPVCKVVKILKGSKEEQNIAALQFLTLKDSDRQKVIRFCFEQEIYLRKKGLK